MARKPSDKDILFFYERWIFNPLIPEYAGGSLGSALYTLHTILRERAAVSETKAPQSDETGEKVSEEVGNE